MIATHQPRHSVYETPRRIASVGGECAAIHALPPGWENVQLSESQSGYVNSTARFNIVYAGRRSFKTQGAARRLVRRALGHQRYRDPHYFAMGPTQQQVKAVYWRRLKELVPEWAYLVSKDRSISESELRIDLYNGSTIKCAGLDKPERVEGVDMDGGVITEFDNCKPDVLVHLRPMMIRGGWLDIEGVPEGRRHLYDLVCEVQDGKWPDTLLHHWTAAEVLYLYLGHERANAELDHARKTMDPLAYQQEYEARFVSFEGLAYYRFQQDVHVGAVRYNPDLPVSFNFDFNRRPGTATVTQEIEAPDWLRKPHAGWLTAIVDEVYIKTSTTDRVCDELIGRYGAIHNAAETPQEVHLHGDPSGGNKTSQGTKGSDWDIVRDKFEPVFGELLKKRYARSDPGIRPRVNAVNARLMTADGTVGMIVSEDCKNVIRDFEGVEADEEGNLIKVQGDPLSHLSDGIAYKVARTHPAGGVRATTELL